MDLRATCVLFPPTLSTVKNADDLSSISANTVDSKIWQPAEHELTCVRLSPRPTVFGELCQQIDAAMDGQSNEASDRSTTVLLK
jgi:hypothetical protein